jgi:hypothetical protein
MMETLPVGPLPLELGPEVVPALALAGLDEADTAKNAAPESVGVPTSVKVTDVEVRDVENIVVVMVGSSEVDDVAGSATGASARFVAEVVGDVVDVVTAVFVVVGVLVVVKTVVEVGLLEVVLVVLGVEVVTGVVVLGVLAAGVVVFGVVATGVVDFVDEVDGFEAGDCADGVEASGILLAPAWNTLTELMSQ